MASSTTAKRNPIFLIAGLIVVAALVAGAAVYKATRTRNVQLRSDEVGRQHDDALNAARSNVPTTAPGMGMVPATTRPAAH